MLNEIVALSYLFLDTDPLVECLVKISNRHVEALHVLLYIRCESILVKYVGSLYLILEQRV